MSDRVLLDRCAKGEGAAFAQLLRRYRQTLARYIRGRIGHPDDAEDVLQETLVAAWIGLRRLREPVSVRAWLIQVARNRCRDYFRAAGRLDVPTEDAALEERAHRFGLHGHRHARTVAEALEALEAVPPAEREAATRFYLEGRSIAEIAAETRCPPGTVKRRLFQARHALRQALGVPLPERSPDMKSESDTQAGTPKPPAFPTERPRIVITERNEPPFAVDCPELRCWSIIPRPGEQASWAAYDPPTWRLKEAAALRAVRPAKVHDVDGVEIEVRLWKPGTGWQEPWALYGRLTERTAQYLATIMPHEGAVLVRTFLDDEFHLDWGEMDRVLADQGRFGRAADGALRQNPGAASSGAGVFDVEIGAHRFTCLRVVDVDRDVMAETLTLTVDYITREGRTVLTKHYCRPEFPDVAEFEVVVDPAERLVVDGATFLHWYDTIMGVAL